MTEYITAPNGKKYKWPISREMLNKWEDCDISKLSKVQLQFLISIEERIMKEQNETKI